MPLLTIITVNLNNYIGLSKTVESVIGQTFKDFEFIVIDGGSNDGSIEVIKKFARNINYWISESDKGIYNAMNKGIQKAQGQYSLFLNSGDSLYNSGVLQAVSQYLTGEFDLICGSSCHGEMKLNTQNTR